MTYTADDWCDEPYTPDLTYLPTRTTCVCGCEDRVNPDTGCVELCAMAEARNEGEPDNVRRMWPRAVPDLKTIDDAGEAA